jgi:hypothetical protein
VTQGLEVGVPGGWGRGDGRWAGGD